MRTSETINFYNAILRDRMVHFRYYQVNEFFSALQFYFGLGSRSPKVATPEPLQLRSGED